MDAPFTVIGDNNFIGEGVCFGDYTVGDKDSEKKYGKPVVYGNNNMIAGKVLPNSSDAKATSATKTTKVAKVSNSVVIGSNITIRGNVKIGSGTLKLG